MKRNKITRLLSVFLLVVTLSIACLCGCEEKELICNFKDFEGEYSFLDFKDENVWLNRSILGVYWSFYEKVQYDNQKSGWKKNSEYSAIELLDIGTNGILELTPAGGEGVIFVEKQIEQGFVDEIKQVLTTIGKSFKLTDKEFVCLDSSKTYKIAKIEVDKETNKGYIDFADFEYRDMSAEFSYYGYGQSLSIFIKDDVILSDTLKYSYAIQIKYLSKK